MNSKMIVLCFTLAVTQFAVGAVLYNTTKFNIESVEFFALSYSVLAILFLGFLAYQAKKLNSGKLFQLAFTSVGAIALGHFASYLTVGHSMALGNYILDYALALVLSAVVFVLYRVHSKT